MRRSDAAEIASVLWFILASQLPVGGVWFYIALVGGVLAYVRMIITSNRGV